MDSNYYNNDDISTSLEDDLIICDVCYNNS